MIYLVTAASLFYVHANFTIRLWSVTINRTITFYALFALSAAIGFQLAFNTGIRIAVSDVYAGTSGLRQLREFHSLDANKNSFVNDLLSKQEATLIVRRTQDELIFVGEPPIPSHRPRFPVVHVKISVNDYYVDSLPIFR